MDKILILDFGSQTSQLIGRRIREQGVYSEILPGDTKLSPVLLKSVKGLILSGAPYPVAEAGRLRPDPAIYDSGLPLLGIGYGFQAMTLDLGGQITTLPEAIYGQHPISLDLAQSAEFTSSAKVFLQALSVEPVQAAQKAEISVWMNLSTAISEPAPGFIQLAASQQGYPVVFSHATQAWFGLQFHPEVNSCQNGSALLAVFAVKVCGARRQWTTSGYLTEIKENLRQRVGPKPVLLLISGGVDSTVVGALLLKVLDPEQVHLMYMDTGLMRQAETKTVLASLESLGARHLHVIHCETEFLKALAGVTEPETKRRLIGDLFIMIQERETARLGLPADYYLAQGTLYTDLIESGQAAGTTARLIKSHHNVGSPLVEAKRNAGRVIEPLSHLYKDEVRSLGRLLGVAEDVIRRHPFPGPGLAVRILGEVTAENCQLLRDVDELFINELKRRGLYDQIWQAFAVLLPLRSVGVVGDSRKYGRVVALRAISSEDGMTAEVYPFVMTELLEIARLITNKLPEIGRVVYDLSSKPPATIEWE